MTVKGGQEGMLQNLRSENVSLNVNDASAINIKKVALVLDNAEPVGLCRTLGVSDGRLGRLRRKKECLPITQSDRCPARSEARPAA